MDKRIAERSTTIRSWAAGYEDCLWLDKVEPYRICRVAGVVQRLRIDPSAGTVETTVTDGNSQLRARWVLRHQPLQLRAAPGSGLVLEGVARPDLTGEVLFEEPSFEIVPGPELD